MSSAKLSPERVRLFGALCFLVYFSSYLTRINYGAVIAAIISDTGITKSQAGLVTTFSFISYGGGQLISGLLGDRLPPKKLIFGGLLATAVLNLCMILCSDIRLMTAIWFVNGFAQSLMWPPLVKTMSLYLDSTQYQRTCVSVSMASALGTITVYLLAPLCIVVSGWRLVFLLSASAAVTTAFAWYFGLRRVDRDISASPAASSDTHIEMPERQKLSFGILIRSGLPLIGLAIIAQGLLRDGITTWMPSFIAETYHLGNAVSILTTVALPLFSMLSLRLAQLVHRKLCRDELMCSGAIFGVGFAACILLALVFQASITASVVLAAVATGCMHGVNLMLICMVPQRFDRYQCVSTVSGLVNSLTYVGSALSSFGFARLSEQFGWHFTLLSWSAIALLGTLSCFLCLKRWKRFQQTA